MQAVNYALYPAQIALLIPFYKLGAWVFGASAGGLTASGVLNMIHHNMLQAIAALWTVTWHAVIAWAIVSALMLLLNYPWLVRLIRGFRPAPLSANG